MAASLPTIIVLAFGAAALGGPDSLHDLLQFTGRSPCLDIAICMFLMIVVTAHLLGAVLLVRFVHDARPGDAAGAGGGAHQGHGAAATDCIAQVSLLVSVCVGFLVAACLVVLPSVSSGGLGKLSSLTYFTGKNSFVAVAVITAAAANAVRGTSRLLSFVRGRRAGNAGHADPASAARASERYSRTRQKVCLLFFIALLFVALSSAASGGLDVQRLFPGFPFRTASTDVPVGVAIATVAGTALVVVRFSRRVRNAAGAAATTTGLARARSGGASAS